MKQLQVSAIQDGTVIDHLPAQSVFKIVDILSVNDGSDEVLIGNNLQSKKLGKKGIIKLSNIFLSQAELDKIALLAAGGTVITIKDYEIIKKHKVEIPDCVTGIVQCFNPNCITNHERATTKFEILNKTDLKLRCHYCEKTMTKSQLAFL